jgi:hypothetical protein
MNGSYSVTIDAMANNGDRILAGGGRYHVFRPCRY